MGLNGSGFQIRWTVIVTTSNDVIKIENLENGFLMVLSIKYWQFIVKKNMVLGVRGLIWRALDVMIILLWVRDITYEGYFILSILEISWENRSTGHIMRDFNSSGHLVSLWFNFFAWHLDNSWLVAGNWFSFTSDITVAWSCVILYWIFLF